MLARQRGGGILQSGFQVFVEVQLSSASCPMSVGQGRA